MQENRFFQRLKEDKGVRAITVTVVAMFLVLTAIIVTTVVANRATQNEPSDLPAGVEDPDDTNPPEDKPGEQLQDTLPSQFLLPVSGVLLSEHDATVQVFSPTMQDYRIHLGIDIATMAGAAVSAMADGVVSQVWEDVRMGHCVAVKHGGDAYTIYKNLSGENAPTVGATVKAGDVIGTVGESAMVEIADEPHLHVEMTVGGLQVDPTEYLSEDAMATLKEDTNYEDAS